MRNSAYSKYIPLHIVMFMATVTAPIAGTTFQARTAALRQELDTLEAQREIKHGPTASPDPAYVQRLEELLQEARDLEDIPEARRVRYLMNHA